MMWAALAMGCAGWIGSILLTLARSTGPDAAVSPRENSPALARPFLWLAILLPLVVWAATLPTTAPFSPGQGWGRGFLMGAIASLLSALVIFRATDSRRELLETRAGALAALFAALAMVAIPLLTMRRAIIEALVGEALGWVAVALILLLGISKSDENDSKSPLTGHWSALLLVNGAAFAATLCGIAALGVYRDFVQADVARGTYSALALVVAMSVALALFVSVVIAKIAREERFSTLFAAFLSLILPLGAGYVLSVKILDDLNLIFCVGAGLALGFLLWWLSWDDATRADAKAVETSDSRIEAQNGVSAWALLVALCGFMLSYGLMQGFGVGLMLLAAWPASVLALPFHLQNAPRSENGALSPRLVARFASAQNLSLCLAFVAILLLSRLFATRFRLDLRGADLSDQFALFGFLAGALVPTLLRSLLFPAIDLRQNSGSTASVLLPRTLLVGVLSLAICAAMVAVWGAKVVPAFFAGLALSLVYAARFERLQAFATTLLSLAMALFLAQWTQKLAPLVELSRADRLQFLLWGAIALVIVFVVLQIGARLLRGAQKSEVLR